MVKFYRETYGGSALSEAELGEAVKRAAEVLGQYERSFRVSGDEGARKMALCAMAEAIVYFQKAQNGEGGLRYAKVGTVSVSGKGIYSAVDISPKAQERELYRTACRYLDIYRGTKPSPGTRGCPRRGRVW